MPPKAPKKTKSYVFVRVNPLQEPDSLSAASTKAPAKRRGRPPKIAPEASSASSSTHAPTATPSVATAATADMSASAASPEVAAATMTVGPASTPAATTTEARASPTRLIATTVQDETPALSKAMATATAVAAVTGSGKRKQRGPQLDGAVNEKRPRKTAAKVTTGPPTSANGWNKSSFSPPDDPTSISLTAEEVSARRKESARVVLEGILNRPLTKTIQAYRTYFKLWKVRTLVYSNSYSLLLTWPYECRLTRIVSTNRSVDLLRSELRWRHHCFADMDARVLSKGRF